MCHFCIGIGHPLGIGERRGKKGGEQRGNGGGRDIRYAYANYQRQPSNAA